MMLSHFVQGYDCDGMVFSIAERWFVFTGLGVKGGFKSSFLIV